MHVYRKDEPPSAFSADRTLPALLDQQHRVDAAVKLRVVGHLCILAPDHLARRRHQPQLRHVHLDHRALQEFGGRGGIEKGPACGCESELGFGLDHP